jgi:hypothetical protein
VGIAIIHSTKEKWNRTFLSYFWEVNKRIVRTPFPIPKISTALQELEGFSYATALNLNMGYYTIRLDPDSSKICTIIFPWHSRFSRHISSKNDGADGIPRVCMSLY